MGLRDLVGQPRAVEILVRAVESGRAHHAYLFEGPPGVGKATAARLFAAALNCERRDPGGCGACHVCEKVATGLHPDVLHWDMTPKGLTERVREVVTLSGFRPHEGRARVIIFDPADALAGPGDVAQPANALLKTLEEPPADTYFVLVSAESRRLPSTVRSRCQSVRFVPISDEEIARVLVGRGIGRGDAEAAAADAGGSLGRALAELEARGDEEEAPLARARAFAERLLEAALTRGEGVGPAAFAAAGDAGGDRELAEAACAALRVKLRDALLRVEGVSPGRVPEGRVVAAEKLLRAGWSGAGLVAASALLDETITVLRGNVAPSLALEHLVLGMHRLGQAPARSAA